MSYLIHYIEDESLAQDLVKDTDFFANVLAIVSYNVSDKKDGNKEHFYKKLVEALVDTEGSPEIVEFLRELLERL